MLFKDNIEYFCHTSGTTGKQKLIPVTKKSRLTSSKYMGILLQKFAYENFKEKWSYERGLLISDMITTTYTPADIPICSATAGGMKAIKHILPFMYTSPIEVMYVKDKNTALYLHLLFALRDNKLMYIAGVFISNILDLLRKLEYSYKYLVDDIKKGRINKKLNFSDKMRKKLNSYLTPNASRAEQLDKEFNACPEVIFLYRRNQILNMASEKTTEEHITSAIQNTIRKFNTTLTDYTTIADNSTSPGRYVFYMEFNKSISPSIKKALENTLDLELQKSNLA